MEPSSPAKGHTRSRSATVLKSIISPKKRSSPQKQDRDVSPTRGGSNSNALLEIQNQGSTSPNKLNKTNRKQKPVEITPWTEPDTPLSPAESVLLSPIHSFAPKDKENTTPPRSGNSEPYTPIWAEFHSQPLKGPSRIVEPEKKQDGKRTQSPQKHPLESSYFPLNTSAAPLPKTQDSCVDAEPSKNGSPAKQSKVQEAVSRWDFATKRTNNRPEEPILQGKELDDAFERILAGRNIPENKRMQMRGLDAHVKRDFVKNEGKVSAASDSGSVGGKSNVSEASSKQSTNKREREERQPISGTSDEAPSRNSIEEPGSPSKRRSRSRSRTFTFSKRDQSKKSRSQSRPRSLMSLKNLSSSSVNSIGLEEPTTTKENRRRTEPDEFVSFLKSAHGPEKVEVGKIQKLRRLLRHESVTWVDDFIVEGGMDAIVALLRQIMKVEWREEHEDMLLHEALLCVKGLCTTQRALSKLDEVQPQLFPDLLKMLFDEERRGPSEYGTRSIITFLFFTQLSSSTPEQFHNRARQLLSYLADPSKKENDQPASFITMMTKPRPYERWCQEVTSVAKEVFWIFLHHLNSVPVSPLDLNRKDTYRTKHFPRERPPVPAAPYVGGVEWEATNYLASHLDLMNGLIASMPTQAERYSLREELRTSGFEQLMGGTLRLCKEKFYGNVHDGLRTWVDAATADNWETVDVRQGPPRSPQKSMPGSPYKKSEPPPQLDLPIGLAVGEPAKDAKAKLGGDVFWAL